MSPAAATSWMASPTDLKTVMSSSEPDTTSKRPGTPDKPDTPDSMAAIGTSIEMAVAVAARML